MEHYKCICVYGGKTDTFNENTRSNFKQPHLMNKFINYV